MKAPMQFLDKKVSNTVHKKAWDDQMPASPQSPPHQNQSNNTNNSFKKDNGTPELLKWIADVTIKRRQIRRKFHCSNLLAEAVLSNSIREAKRVLAQKQEEKRRNLHNFHYNYNVTVTCSPLANNSSSDSTSSGQMDQELQSILSSVDSFFNQLKEIR